MRSKAVTSAFCLLATAAFGGMSGTYTIKPAGGGDFLTLYAAGQVIDSLGMSGNCVFEIYGDTLLGPFYADGVSGSDSWTTTFRPGPSQDPVILGDEFCGAGYHNVKIENLRFLTAYMTIAGSSGWRISGCRFSTHDWAVKIEGTSSSDTIDGNMFDVWGTGMGHYPCIVTEGPCNGNVIFNNMIGDDSCGLQTLVDLEGGYTTFVYNTLFMSPVDVPDASCFGIWDPLRCDVRNNVFVLARTGESLDMCVSIPQQGNDSILLDYNCYFVESLGYVGGRPFVPYLYDWSGWRGLGFEANGISADPRFVSSADLHLRPGSPCNQRATPIAGISFDIDGDPRDPTHPDMGADEIAGDAVEEGDKPPATSRKLEPTVTCNLPPGAVAFDAMGRRVVSPKPGVYFVRDVGRMSKVVIQR